MGLQAHTGARSRSLMNSRRMQRSGWPEAHGCEEGEVADAEASIRRGWQEAVQLRTANVVCVAALTGYGVM